MMMMMMMMMMIIIIIIITGDIDTINSNDRIAATMYSLGTWFAEGINTLHKGAKDDDDDDDDDNNNNNNNDYNIE
jgi:hypothetical protein